jgi:hypothetical protein
MRLFTARRLALAALAPALLLLSVVPGCSNGSEGERCGDMYGTNDGDCGSGLVCKSFSDEEVNRCCYPNKVTDSRCAIVGTGSATNSKPDAGGVAEAGAAGSSAEPTGVGGMTTELAGAGGA